MPGIKWTITFAILSCILINSLVNSANTTTTSAPPATTRVTTVTPIPTPTKTTAPPPTTLPPAPTPKPLPKNKIFPENVGSWIVEDESKNVTCILLKGAIQISVNYTSSPSNSTQTAKVDIPETANGSGVCGPEDQTLTLKWYVTLEDKSVKENEMTMTFHKQQIKSASSLGAIEYNYLVKDVAATVYKDETCFPNATGPVDQPIQETLGLTSYKYMIPMTESYSCKAENEWGSQNNSSLVIRFQSLQIQAFSTNPVNHTEFGSGVPCAEDGMSVAAISAGVIFGIVVLVLVIMGIVGAALYLVKRSRANASRAYENM